MLRAILCVIMSTLSLSFFSQEKINGISLVSHRPPTEERMIEPIVNVGANWVTLIPYASGKTGSDNLRYPNKDSYGWGESPQEMRQCMDVAHENGLKVMIKPQLWIDHGSYTGYFELTSDEEWNSFEKDYRDYIMQYVDVAIEGNAEMFCIGTELTKWCELRPQYWSRLINDIRLIYDGKIVYAANWDAYKRMPFWSKLDYIGIDAYFPLCDEHTPSVTGCVSGWEKHKKEMKKYSERFGKPIIFTEWGFRSNDYNCSEPWNYNKGGRVNLEAQANAFEATFDCFWNEPWFHGGFIWKWYSEHQRVGGPECDTFTPQRKPAEQVIKAEFEKYSSDSN